MTGDPTPRNADTDVDNSIPKSKARFYKTSPENTGEPTLSGRREHPREIWSRRTGNWDATLRREGERMGQRDGTLPVGDVRGAGAAARGPHDMRRTVAHEPRGSNAMKPLRGTQRSDMHARHHDGRGLPVARRSATSRTNNRPGKLPANLSEANPTQSFYK